MLFPFNGKKLFFCIVAFLASGDHVSFGGSAATGDGHNMVHGQFLGRRRTPAVVADAFGAATFPPLGVPEFSGLAALPFDVFFLQIICEWFHMSFYLILKNRVLYARILYLWVFFEKPMRSNHFTISLFNIS